MDRIETCQDKPENCVFWSEDAEDLYDAEMTYENYLKGKNLKPYKKERIFGEHIIETKDAFQYLIVRFWDAWKALAKK